MKTETMKPFLKNREFRFAIAIAVVIPLAIFGIEKLYFLSDRLVRNERDMLRLQGIANRLDALEWRAIQARSVDPELADAIAENRERAARVFARLQTERFLSEPLQRIESAYQSYAKSVDRLLKLLEAEAFQQALEVDENEVDPSFEELHEIILTETASVSNTALSFKFWAFWGTRGIGLFLLAIIGILFFQSYRANQKIQRMIAENADRREKLLEKEQQVLEEKIVERTQALQTTNEKLERVLRDLQDSQLQLVQSEKMVALGNLVAGVAHEINNPVGFIHGNLEVARDYLQNLLHGLALYQHDEKTPISVAEEIEEMELDFIAEDFPKLIASMQSGCDRIRNISTSLRTFSRTDTDKKIEFNLHEGIDSTLLILKYRLKANEARPAIEILKNYGDIPAVQCYAGQLNQVFMNILANAIDALDESNAGKSFQDIENQPNRITIATELSADKKNAIVRITDNGSGMPEEIKAKIFEQGFTTKGVGKGTGLGMAIARQIIIEKHGGTIECCSESGKGTTFAIALPIEMPVSTSGRDVPVL